MSNLIYTLFVEITSYVQFQMPWRKDFDAEVTTVDEWNNSQKLREEIDNLLIEFQTFLVGKKLKAEINQMQIITKRNDSHSYNTNNIIPYVEKTP